LQEKQAMTHTAIPAFETTMQTTHVWIGELMAQLGWSDRQRAYAALRAVLHALRDHLSPEAAAALGAQLPMLVRGFYYEGWRPSGKPLKERKLNEFLAHVEENLRSNGAIDPRQVSQQVFALLKSHLSEGEIHSVQAALPAALQSLWP
jgi:uncharacterized protein (DUF2267 family)